MKNKFYVHILRTHQGVMTLGGDDALKTNILRRAGHIYGFDKLIKANTFIRQVVLEGGEAILQPGKRT